MKEFIKSTGLVLYFIITQCIATIGLIFYKFFTDGDWFYDINDCISQNGVLSASYFRLISEILYPALILADIAVLVPMILHARKKKEKIFDKIDRQSFIDLFQFAIIANFIVSFIVESLPETTTGEYNQLMSVVTNGSFGMVLLTSGILAPIIEELIFRYGICGLFSKKSDTAAIVISAFFFGLAHMNLIQSTYAFILGLFLGFLYVKTKNLVYPIVFHLTVNTSSVLYEYAPEHIKSLCLCFAGVCGISLLLKFRKKYYEKKDC